jgi:hypothetical protein
MCPVGASQAPHGGFTQAEAQYLEQLAGQGILPQTLGLHYGRDEVGPPHQSGLLTSDFRSRSSDQQVT